MRNAVMVALIVGRNDLFLEQLVQRIRIGRVLRVGIFHALSAVDHPPVRAVVALGPPAVADAQVRDAVDSGLHAARAARFERFSRRVQPDVASLRQEMRDVQIVIVDEGDAPAIHGVDRVTIDVLQVMLSCIVGRMGLAGKHDLNVPPLRRQQPDEAFRDL